MIEAPPPTDITYYLSGPISGDIAGNTRRFVEACVELRARGYTIVSPVEVCEGILLNDPDPRDWAWYMRRDIEAMMSDEVSGIIMLPRWEESRGARTEVALAAALDFHIVTYGSCLQRTPLVSA